MFNPFSLLGYGALGCLLVFIIIGFSFFITWLLLWVVWNFALIGLLGLALPALTFRWALGIWIILVALSAIFKG